jgi:carboxyl-terminal processing protease
MIDAGGFAGHADQPGGESGQRIVSPIDDTPASRAGIQPGDSTVKINGKLIDPQNVETMYQQLRGKPGSKIELTIVHAKSNKPIDLHLVRRNITVSSVRVRELEPGFTYVRISQFKSDTANDLNRKLGEQIKKDGPQKGAVLDLRNNPGGGW